MPKDHQAFDTLAHASYATGHWAEAVNAWSEVEKLDPNYFNAHDRASCVDDRDRFDTAKSKAKEADQTAPGKPPKAPQ